MKPYAVSRIEGEDPSETARPSISKGMLIASFHIDSRLIKGMATFSSIVQNHLYRSNSPHDSRGALLSIHLIRFVLSIVL